MKSIYPFNASLKHSGKKLLLLAGVIAGLSVTTFAQTKIGDNPGTPRDPSAMLEVSSTAAPFRGFLIPRITTVQRDAITNPAKGLMIFNTTSNQVEVNTGTPAAPVWSVPAPPAPMAWLLTGNTGINPAMQFIGTTDAQPVVFRSNNAERMRITDLGLVGIGTNDPVTKLHVDSGTFRVSNKTNTTNPAIMLLNDNGGGGYADDIAVKSYGNPGSALDQYAAGGTAAAPLSLTTGGDIGYLNFYGYTTAGEFGARSFIRARYWGDGTNNKTSLTLGTSGNDRIFINDSGLVGIGTITPVARLDVAGTARISGNAGTPTTITGRNVTGDIGNVTLGAGLSLTGGVLSAAATTAGWALAGNTGTNPANNFIGTTDKQPVVFRINNSEALRVDTSRFVGIGTVTPLSKLHVDSGSVVVTPRTNGTNPGFLLLNDNGGGNYPDDATIRSFGSFTSPAFEQYVARGTAAAPLAVTNGTVIGSLNFYGYANANPGGARTYMQGTYVGDGNTPNTVLIFGTSGGERMRITDSGRVGIGTTTSLSRLSLTPSVNEAKITLWDGGNTANHYGVGVSDHQFNFHVPGVSDRHVFFAGGRNAGGTELMRIQGDGRVGIGNTNPNAMLDISTNTENGMVVTAPATVGARIPLTVQNTATSNNSASTFRVNSLRTGHLGNVDFGVVGNAGTIQMYTQPGNTGGSLALNPLAGGYVGVGTATPGYKFHIMNDGGGDATPDDMAISSFGASTNPGLELLSARGTAAAPTNLNNNAPMGRIAFSGRANGTYVTSAVAAYYKGDGTTLLTNLAFATSGAEQMWLTEAGNLGIGTNAPTAKLSVNGTANNTTGVWGVFSDDRIKTVDDNFTDGLETVMKIRPVKFHYTNNAPFKSDDQQIGIVAQEMEAIAPYMISKEKIGKYDDLRKYNAQALPYILVNAIQELKKELNGITNTNASLQQELSNLKAENAQLKADKNTMPELLARIAKLEGTLGVASK